MRVAGHTVKSIPCLGNLNWAQAARIPTSCAWGAAAADLKPVVNAAYSDSAQFSTPCSS